MNKHMMSFSDWFITKEDCESAVEEADPIRVETVLKYERKIKPKNATDPLRICVGLLGISSPSFCQGSKKITKYKLFNSLLSRKLFTSFSQ